jgi:hypothetical protein
MNIEINKGPFMWNTVYIYIYIYIYINKYKMTATKTFEIPLNKIHDWLSNREPLPRIIYLLQVIWAEDSTFVSNIIDNKKVIEIKWDKRHLNFIYLFSYFYNNFIFLLNKMIRTT